MDTEEAKEGGRGKRSRAKEQILGKGYLRKRFGGEETRDEEGLSEMTEDPSMKSTMRIQPFFTEQ